MFNKSKNYILAFWAKMISWVINWSINRKRKINKLPTISNSLAVEVICHFCCNGNQLEPAGNCHLTLAGSNFSHFKISFFCLLFQNAVSSLINMLICTTLNFIYPFSQLQVTQCNCKSIFLSKAPAQAWQCRSQIWHHHSRERNPTLGRCLLDRVEQ